MNRRQFITAAMGSAAFLAIPSLAKDGGPSSSDEKIGKAKIILPDTYVHPDLATTNTEDVGIAWVLGVDISSSIQAPEYNAQLEALAEVVERDDFRQSIFGRGGPGSASLLIVDYDVGSKILMPAIDFRENDVSKFRDVAQLIRELQRRSNGGTYHPSAMKNADLCFDRVPWGAKRKYFNLFTDGGGSEAQIWEYQLYRKILGEKGVITSSLVTRPNNSSSTIEDFAHANITTPSNTYTMPNSTTILPGGITREVAQEMQTQTTNVARYSNAVFDVFRNHQIRFDGASLTLDGNTRLAQQDAFVHEPLS